MENLLVSACLLGVCCKYSGGANTLPESALARLRERYRLIPVCPETAGGLPVPREPSERRGRFVVTRGGSDVTEAFRRGAQTALLLGEIFGCRAALLKENSPSCGVHAVYDGSFSHNRLSGQGVCAALLAQHGIRLYSEKDMTEELLEKLLEEDKDSRQ